MIAEAVKAEKAVEAVEVFSTPILWGLQRFKTPFYPYKTPFYPYKTPFYPYKTPFYPSKDSKFCSTIDMAHRSSKNTFLSTNLLFYILN